MAENIIRKKYGKRGFIYLLIFLAALGGVGLLSLLTIDAIDAFYYLALLLGLIIGSLHVVFMYRFLPIQRNEFTKGLILTLLLLLGSAILSAVIYYFRGGYYSFLTGLLTFIVPYLGYQTYLFLMKIPPSSYKLWYYPINEDMPDLDMIDLSQIEVVQFVFNKKHQEVVKTNFTSKAPLNMTLGQLFFIFINDYNEKNAQNTIDLMNDQKTLFGWVFYRKGKWFSKNFFFDPDLSFRDNQIQPNEIIQVERIK